MKQENIIKVMLRPATGFQYGKMLCEFFEDCFELTVKKESLFQSSAVTKFKIPYKAIDNLAPNNYMYISGIRITLNDPSIDYPISPSKIFGGLLGGIIALSRKKLFILYFSNKKDYNFFIERIKKGNKKCLVDCN